MFVRYFLVFALISFILPGCSSPDEQTLRTFTEAQELFDAAESQTAEEQQETFRRAALIYQGLVDRGVESGPIYYNLGNARARCGESGRALAAYHRALRFMPLDPHIPENLRTVQGHAPPEESSRPLVEYLFFWQDWIGVRQKIRGSTLLVAATVVLGIVGLFVRKSRRASRILRRIVCVLLFFSIIACLSVGYDWYRFKATTHALIAVDEATPRKGNSETYEPLFTEPLRLGAIAVISGERGDWYRLRFDSNHEGWLPKSQVCEF